MKSKLSFMIEIFIKSNNEWCFSWYYDFQTSLMFLPFCNFQTSNFSTIPEDPADDMFKPKETNHQQPRNGFKLLVSSSSGKGKLKKRVSFADDLGFSLEVVRIFTESTDTPPRLRPEILSSITIGATAGVTEKPPLVLQFAQPASDYLVFREKLERECVSLENVILKDYNLIGTIKVKNISFEKTVRVRCTFDGWETNTDIVASYVPNNSMDGHSSVAARYDTFKFEMSVPPTTDFSKKIQFCICYEVGNSQYWDNNGGDNYEVTSADWKEKDDSIFTIDYERDWTTYSSWGSNNSSVPYYWHKQGPAMGLDRLTTVISVLDGSCSTD